MNLISVTKLQRIPTLGAQIMKEFNNISIILKFYTIS